MAPSVKPEQDPGHVPTYAEWQAAQYGPHRFGQDPTAQMPMGRTPTYAEWQQMQQSPNPSALRFPALPTPKFVADQTKRLNPNTPTDKGTPLPAFDIRDPTTYLSPALRQVVNPSLEHPFATALLPMAPAVGPLATSVAGALGASAVVAGGIGTAASIGTVGALVAPMVKNIAQYGWQVAHESQMSPEEKAIALQDPHRISGESAAMQAILLGIGPLIHVGAKGVGRISQAADVSGGMMEAGATGVTEHVSRDVAELVGGINSEQARTVEAKAAALQSALDRRDATTAAASAADLQDRLARLGIPQGKTATARPAATLVIDATGRVRVVPSPAPAEVAPTRNPLIPSVPVLTPKAEPPSLIEPPGPRPTPSTLFFETPRGAGVLGSAAAAHGLPETASPYPPATQLDLAWKEGHGMAPGVGRIAESETPRPAETLPLRIQPPTVAPVEPVKSAQTELPIEPVAGPEYKGPVSLYGRLSDDALGAEYRALLEKRTEVAPAAQAPLWTPEREAEAVANIENRRRPDGSLTPADKRALGNLQAAQGEGYYQGRHTFESAAAEQQLTNLNKHITAIEKQITDRGLDATELMQPPKTGGSGLAPIEGTGETRTRGLATSTERMAVEADIAKEFGDLPQYQRVSKADQSEKALAFMARDPEAARRVALGEENPPEGLLGGSVYTAVRRQAINEGDAALVHDLITHGFAERATTMGQEISMLGERLPEDPVAAGRAINKLRSGGAKAGAAIKNAVKDMQKSVEPNLDELLAFFESMKC